MWWAVSRRRPPNWQPTTGCDSEPHWGELIGYDYEAMGLQQLYRSADGLLKHRDALETHLFGTAQSLFGLTETITLYDVAPDLVGVSLILED